MKSAVPRFVIPLLLVLLFSSFIMPALGQQSDACPPRVLAALDLGDDSLRQQDYESAVRYFTCALAIDPEEAYALALRGRAHYFLENYEAAIDDLSAATALIADQSTAYYYLGLSYDALGDSENAALS